MKFKETHLDCPCGKHKDCYAINEDGSGKCFSCGKFTFPKPFWKHIRECIPRPYASRGVPSWVGERINFVEYVDTKGFVQFFGYNYPNGVFKARRKGDKHDQQMKVPEGKTKPALGGIGLYDPGTSRNCVVVEGEPDAAAAYYMLNDKMANETPVYWLLGANISNKDKAVIVEELSKYERVIMAIESDDAGNKAKETLAQLLPKSIRVSSLVKHKDANDYLLAGDTKEFKRCIANYARYTPEFIYSGIDKLTAIWDEAETEFYVPTPFPNLNELVKGIPLGHIFLVTGPEGIGKTEILRALAWSALSKADGPVCPVSMTLFEEDNKTMLKAFGCYDQGVNFRDPDKQFVLSEIQPTLEKLAEDFYITDFYKARDDMSVQSFMEKISYLHFVCGVKYFFLDPVNQLRPDAPEEPLVKFLDGISMEMARFCVDNQVGCVWTAHTTDEGKTRDSRMIAKAASIRVDVYRDLENFDEQERNKTYLTVSKNRPFSRVGPAGHVVFDPTTFTLQSSWDNDRMADVIPSGQPGVYVRESGNTRPSEPRDLGELLTKPEVREARLVEDKGTAVPRTVRNSPRPF